MVIFGVANIMLYIEKTAWRQPKIDISSLNL